MPSNARNKEERVRVQRQVTVGVLVAVVLVGCGAAPPSGQPSASASAPPSEPSTQPSGGPGSPGGGGGSGGLGPPGPPAACGAEQWFGPLTDFIVRLGSPPPPTFIDTLADIASLYAPPLLGAPYNIATGFRTAYRPLADQLKSDCPGISGDPHILTIDRARYDFQAVGEFVALRSANGDIDVQVRFAPVGTTRQASVLTRVAARVDGRTVVIDGPEGTVSVDGEALESPALVATAGGAFVLRDGDRVAVLWPDAFTTITMTGVGQGHLSLYPTVHLDRDGTVEGLFGNSDGNAANDLRLPDGTPVESDFDDLYGAFREAWRVSGDASLLGGSSTFDPSYPAARVELNDAQIRAARDRCLEAGVVVTGLLENCVHDVAVTDDDAYAMRYAAEQPARRTAAGDCGDVGDPVSTRGFGTGGTYRTDADLVAGELAWTIDRGVVGVAATADGLLVVDLRNGFHRLDPGGTTVASFEARTVPHVPAVTTERAFVLTADSPAAHSVLSIALDGTACWQLAGYEGERFGTVSLDDGLLLVTGHNVESAVGTIVGIDPDSGDIRWTRAFHGQLTPPAMAGGLVLLGIEGAAVALSADSGRTRWSVPARRALAVAALDDVAYVADADQLIARDLGTGADRWTYRGTTTIETIAVDGGRVVGSGGRRAFGLDPDDGTVTWTLSGEGTTVYSQPVIVGEVVYIVAGQSSLVAIDLDDGQERLRIPVPRMREPPASIGDMVLAIDDTGALRAYR